MSECKIWVAVKMGNAINYGGIHPTIPNRIEWGGSSHCTLLSEDQIIKEYPIKKKKGEDYWDVVDRMEIQFYKDYYVPKKAEKMFESEGILAPNGDFYPCEYGAHEFLAKKISIHLYDKKGNASDLEAKGYHRFQDDGLTYGTSKFTQAQINTMFDYAQETKDKNIKRHLMQYIKDNDPL